MRSGSEGRGAAQAVALMLVLLMLGGCGHWPWHRKPPPAPAPIHEVDISGAGLEGAPQYWKRNTLLIDLSAASGAGTLTLKPAAASGWPVRLAFRVTPGAIAVLEVQGAQRVSLPIDPHGVHPVDLELDPAVLRPQTPQLTVSFGPGAAPAP